MIKVGDMVHFEATDVIRTVKYCNFSSCIMKLQYLKCILPRIFFSKNKFHFIFSPFLEEINGTGKKAFKKIISNNEEVFHLIKHYE